MARPTIGTIIELDGGIAVMSRPDTWANTELAASLDARLNRTRTDVILWFTDGARVIADRPVTGGGRG